jgi:hypothetical protein
MAELISIPAPSVIENYQDMEVMVLGSNQDQVLSTRFLCDQATLLSVK